MKKVDAFEKLLNQSVGMIGHAGEVYGDESLQLGAATVAATIVAINDAGDDEEAIERVFPKK